MRRVLLLSGGVDSTCIAKWQLPEHCLSINYGQSPALAEERAARSVAQHLSLPFDHISVNASEVGGGLMVNKINSSGTPEWWPYRNQLLITLAAAWAISHGFEEIILGTVAGDGDRHADGTRAFYDAMNAVLQAQEGKLAVTAPSIEYSTPELITLSQADEALLGLTHSCHTGDIACAHCPGCIKRAEVLQQTGLLQ